eukprot:RCo027207
MAFTLPEFDYTEALLQDQSHYATDVGGGILRHKGYEAELVTLPYPDRPDITTIPKLFAHAVAQHSGNPCYGERSPPPPPTASSSSTSPTGIPQWGPYHFQSYAEVLERVQNFAAGLLEGSGGTLRPGDRVGIYGKNCLRWVVAQQAVYWAGMTVVPLYDTFGQEAVQYIIEHSALSVVIVSPENLPRLLQVVQGSGSQQHTSTVKTIVVMAHSVVPVPGLGCALDAFSSVEALGKVARE